MLHRKGKVLGVFLIALSLIVFMGCTKETPQVEEQVVEEAVVEVDPITVRVGSLKGPTSIGMIKVLEETPDFGEKYIVEYEIMPSPDVLIAKLLSGELDIATVPTNAAAKVYNKGIDYKLAATSIWGVMYGVGTDTSITSVKDLAGKEVHSIGKGVTPDVITRFLLEAEGIDPEEGVTIQYGQPPTELAQMMVAGKVELAVLPEPFVTMVTMQNKDMKVLFDLQKGYNAQVGEGSDNLAQTSIVVKGDLMTENSEFVDAFLEQYESSVNWVTENPVEASLLVEKHGIIGNAKIAELAIPRLNLKYISVKESKVAVEKYLEVLFNFSPETIGGQMPDENFYLTN